MKTKKEKDDRVNVSVGMNNIITINDKIYYFNPDTFKIQIHYNGAQITLTELRKSIDTIMNSTLVDNIVEQRIEDATDPGEDY